MFSSRGGKFVLPEENSDDGSQLQICRNLSSSSRRHERRPFTFPQEEDEDVEFDISHGAVTCVGWRGR
ncbi:hypothetical protein JZ751_010723 [Albula glossodonta]|uniref:Uncharacterized protein n=1 Tax=Albula glossodonta TaxID=121402 RepID=A0A8T2N0I4_9TELE|nr:hypothetical protein JZ751_010723 [Albula glossodonta]